MRRVSAISEKSAIKKEIFRAYDIRGIYPEEVNPEAVYLVSRALAEKVFKKGKIVIARDGRLGSPELYKAAIKGLKHSNILQNVGLIEVGLTTTPMFYFLVNKLKAMGGIMITASHNPKEYNGMKVAGKGAKMIGGKEILKIISKS